MGNRSHSHITEDHAPLYVVPVGLEPSETLLCQVRGAGGVYLQHTLACRVNPAREIPSPKTSSSEQCLDWTQAEDTSAIWLFLLLLAETRWKILRHSGREQRRMLWNKISLLWLHFSTGTTWRPLQRAVHKELLEDTVNKWQEKTE